ncbi:MAG: branched-chain amino acid transport system ATP-binding protein [Actinomycetota bacterium]|jgi:branched-chain amino acid transport system ATP-binding protein|nr:branched-chain amino acid transport system ATP-binding protein [Actinomycetota bacterium]MDQ1565683.1 branched-chain amino acid transport system ATP-binding protein [Actinomycetota bacterium]
MGDITFSHGPVAVDGGPRPSRPAGQAVLEASGITTCFGGLRANHEVDLTVTGGRVTALIGPNGAGKTTFFNVVTGGIRLQEGTVRVFGEEITDATPSRMARLGLIRTFQDLKVLQRLSVFDNVVIGAGRGQRPSLLGALIALPAARRKEAAIRQVAEWALEFVELGDLARTYVGDLPYAAERRVEIARALAARPRLLLLDEPTAGMGPGETLEIGALLNRVVDDLGIPVFVIEHDMRVVRGFADWVYVLEQGRIITDGPPEDVLSDERVIESYLGARRDFHA